MEKQWTTIHNWFSLRARALTPARDSDRHHPVFASHTGTRTRAHAPMPPGRPPARCRRPGSVSQLATGAGALLLALLLSSPHPAAAYILPGTYPTSYRRGEVLYGELKCV